MFDIDAYKCTDGKRWMLHNDPRASDTPCR